MGGVKGRMEDMLAVPAAPAAGSALCPPLAPPPHTARPCPARPGRSPPAAASAPRARGSKLCPEFAASPRRRRQLPPPPPSAPLCVRGEAPTPAHSQSVSHANCLLAAPARLPPPPSLPNTPPREGGRDGGWKEGGEAAGPPGTPRLHRRPRRPRLPEGDRAPRGPRGGPNSPGAGQGEVLGQTPPRAGRKRNTGLKPHKCKARSGRGRGRGQEAPQRGCSPCHGHFIRGICSHTDT